MNPAGPFSEDDLQAYVDGRLDAARRAEIDAHLAANPQEAEGVRAFRRQNEMLQTLFNPVLEEPVPPRLASALSARPPRAWWSYGTVAASAVIAFLLGWYLRGEESPVVVAQETLAHQAAVAYTVYAPEVLHPVEVAAAHEDHLTKWLSKRLGFPVRAPHLEGAGFKLVGGRLLPGGAGPAAQFMYQDAQRQRLTLYVSTDVPGNRETAFRYSREGGVSVFYWVDGPLGYALSGELDRERLLGVAEVVYRDLNQ